MQLSLVNVYYSNKTFFLEEAHFFRFARGANIAVCDKLYNGDY